MLSLQAPHDLLASPMPGCRRGITEAARVVLMKCLTNELHTRLNHKVTTHGVERDMLTGGTNKSDTTDPLVVAKLYAIMEAVDNRIEMHKNVGDQRNNWNCLLLTSINMMTLAAVTMVSLAATNADSKDRSPFLGFKLASTALYVAAFLMLVVMNEIQPSQLAEEQRNATRLFKRLHGRINTMLSIGAPTIVHVEEAMEEIWALDKAYPLPLIGQMLDKFPEKAKPETWWPQRTRSHEQALRLNLGGRLNRNGWNPELEDEMRAVVGVLKRKDLVDYMKLSRDALKLNKVLAILGPLLTVLGGFGSLMVGCDEGSSWAVVMGVVCGALACTVNTLQHGGQVGMVFEMYRNTAGFFKHMEEKIESNLHERDVELRENGEVFKLKIALGLGRDLYELHDLGRKFSQCGRETSEEFASKLF